MPGQALAGSAAAACAAAVTAGSSRQRRQKSAQSAKRVAAKSASLSARSAPPAALRGAGRRLERRAAAARRCRAEHDAGGAFPAAAESHASSPPAAGAPCCGAGCSEPPSADGAHSHAHSHAHAHGDEAHLQAGLSHGHTHGGDEALRQGGGNPVQRALAAFFRLCGLMQLAGLLRNSLPVISAAWVCLVRAPPARPRHARQQWDARACRSSRRPCRAGVVAFALRRCMRDSGCCRLRWCCVALCARARRLSLRARISGNRRRLPPRRPARGAPRIRHVCRSLQRDATQPSFVFACTSLTRFSALRVRSFWTCRLRLRR